MKYSKLQIEHTELSRIECSEVQGYGSGWLGVLIKWVIDSWSDLKSGASDGSDGAGGFV